MKTETKQSMAWKFRWFRWEKANLRARMNPIAKTLKEKCRKIKGRGFTLLVQNSQRRTLIRSEVVKALGEAWVRRHERKTNFKMIRIVEDKK
jgi:hypothetical protein